MANVTGDRYTVVKGDTLRDIASSPKVIEYYPSLTRNQRINKIVELNNIKNLDLIYPGQVLIIYGSEVTPTSTPSGKVVVTPIRAMISDNNKLFITWDWNWHHNTEDYRVKWEYYTKDGYWFVGSDSPTQEQYSVHDIDSGAIQIRVSVLAQSKTFKPDGKTETNYFNSTWSNYEHYNVVDKPDTPPAPSINQDGLKVEFYVDGLDLDIIHVDFEVSNHDGNVFSKIRAGVMYGHSSYTCTLKIGNEYKARIRSFNGSAWSDWSGYTDGWITTPPNDPAGFTVCRSEKPGTTVYLAWEAVTAAKKYEIQHVNELSHFDTTGSSNGATVEDMTEYRFVGLDTGKEYFFRLRAINRDGHASGWSKVSSIVLGEPPAAPTTWSSTNTAMIGEPLTLYWVHNSKDESTQTVAQIMWTVEGDDNVYTKEINSINEEDDEKTSHYSFDTTGYANGAVITWQVRTAGATQTYGDYSDPKQFKIYAAPSLSMTVKTSSGVDIGDTLKSFPICLNLNASPTTQTAVGYSVTIKSNEHYETIDNFGRAKIVSPNEIVFSRYYNAIKNSENTLSVEISAQDVNLDNNITYTLSATVSMNSGLVGKVYKEFLVEWNDQQCIPNAEIGIDKENLTAIIRPFCEDRDEGLLSDILLSVYRREFDGSFTEIETGIDNLNNTFVVDPHPSLDMARYRIVATTKSTGAVSYYDVPGYPVGEKAIILQWDETWSSFDVTVEATPVEPAWSGSLLRLPYNVDVSENNSIDSSLVEYIGREHPVSYYGTQIKSSGSWSVDVPKDDVETIYALRRLSRWAGDVYVREPSGTGYWASITVSFSQTHLELTIPVSISVKRVEGGA